MASNREESGVSTNQSLDLASQPMNEEQHNEDHITDCSTWDSSLASTLPSTQLLDRSAHIYDDPADLHDNTDPTPKQSTLRDDDGTYAEVVVDRTRHAGSLATSTSGQTISRDQSTPDYNDKDESRGDSRDIPPAVPVKDWRLSKMGGVETPIPEWQAEVEEELVLAEARIDRSGKDKSKHNALKPDWTVDSSQVVLNVDSPTGYQQPTNSRCVYEFESRHQGYLTADAPANNSYIRAEEKIRRICARGFSLFRLAYAVPLFFVLELVTFLSRDVIQRLFVRSLAILGSQALKPLLTALFNGVLQPVLTLLWNVSSALRDMMRPLLEISAAITRQVAVALSGLRLVQVDNTYGGQGAHSGQDGQSGQSNDSGQVALNGQTEL